MSFGTRFYNACKNGDSVSLSRLLNQPCSKYDLYWGLQGACEGGHRLLVDTIIKSADCILYNDDIMDWNYGLDGACLGGHRDLVDLMIEKGADDFECGLRGACEGGHRDLVDLMIENGANDWNCGLVSACRGGNHALVDLMIEKGATDWDEGLHAACRSGNCVLVDLMIEKGATDWNFGLMSACLGGHRELVDLMIEKGANNWNDGLWTACENRHYALIDLMVEKGATDLSSVIRHFHDDKRLIAHIALRLPGQIRNKFIYEIRKRDKTNLVLYLSNRHIIRVQPLQTILARKGKLRNILKQLVCTDVATWSCTFMAINVVKKNPMKSKKCNPSR